jgi:ABC-type spermidine/putrescine transport system permease subunit I
LTSVPTAVRPPGASSEVSGRSLRQLASWLHRHAGVRILALLSAPMAWLVLAYLGSLAVLLVSSLWTVNSFTGELIRQPTFANFETIFTEPVYRNIAFRSIAVAAAVTIVDTVIALPIALFMAKVASPRVRYWLVIAILTPLWAS